MKLYLLRLLLAAITMSGLALSCAHPQSDANNYTVLAAAIVDQLHNLQPNQTFIDEASEILRTSGFNVDVYQGHEVTLQFYRDLPTFDYNLVIFRAHSGMLRGATETTCLFTDEAYANTKETWGQLFDEILPAQMREDYPTVFAINPRFVQKSMNERFRSTVIIMMGCSTAYRSDMAEAFIDKGASAYLGWSASVGLDYTDKATLILLSSLCTKRMTFEQAVSELMASLGRDPDYDACPKYYPGGIDNMTLEELIR